MSNWPTKAKLLILVFRKTKAERVEIYGFTSSQQSPLWNVNGPLKTQNKISLLDHREQPMGRPLLMKIQKYTGPVPQRPIYRPLFPSICQSGARGARKPAREGTENQAKRDSGVSERPQATDARAAPRVQSVLEGSLSKGSLISPRTWAFSSAQQGHYISVSHTHNTPYNFSPCFSF